MHLDACFIIKVMKKKLMMTRDPTVLVPSGSFTYQINI